MHNITDINLCKKVLHSLYVIKRVRCQNTPKNIWCKVKGQSQNMHSEFCCCCSPFKRYVWVNFKWPIRILEITAWSLRLRLKSYGMFTLFWIEYLYHKSPKISTRGAEWSFRMYLMSDKITDKRKMLEDLIDLFTYTEILIEIAHKCILIIYKWMHENKE